MIIMYLPLAYLLRYFYGISGIFMAYAIANIFSAVIAYKWANNSVQGQIEKMS
jgi:hypothetical protein